MDPVNATCVLFPEHQADLEKSGLSTDTITAAGIYSVTAADLKRILGWIPSVESGLVFPYPNVAEFSVEPNKGTKSFIGCHQERCEGCSALCALHCG